jgi:DNA-binding NtrC family response regulator
MLPPTPHTSILLVEPDGIVRAILHTAASELARVESYSGFEVARTRLRREFFDFVVANLCLDAYNGLHLAYARGPGRSPHVIVYSDHHDPWLAREAQRAGAFYEIQECLPVTLAGYVRGTLPARDRRDPARERRAVFRGGRRCWDLHLVSRLRETGGT